MGTTFAETPAYAAPPVTYAAPPVTYAAPPTMYAAPMQSVGSMVAYPQAAPALTPQVLPGRQESRWQDRRAGGQGSTHLAPEETQQEEEEGRLLLRWHCLLI